MLRAVGKAGFFRQSNRMKTDPTRSAVGKLDFASGLISSKLALHALRWGKIHSVPHECIVFQNFKVHAMFLLGIGTTRCFPTFVKWSTRAQVCNTRFLKVIRFLPVFQRLK